MFVNRPLSEFCKSIDCLYLLLGPLSVSGETGNSSYAIFGGQTKSIFQSLDNYPTIISVLSFPPLSVILHIMTQTLFYDFNRDCTDSLKVSLASALRH